MPEDPLRWLTEAAADRAAAGLRRELRPRHVSTTILDLASNDYLGLARDERVVAAAISAARTWGAGSTGSRLVTGSTELHAELEQTLANLVGTKAALAFSSGFMANLGALTALSGPDCLVISDRGNHASLFDGCRLSKARCVAVKHGDLAAARSALEQRTESRALLVVDAVNSVDGDLLDLAGWHQLAREHASLLLVDDAHGLGVRGSGRGSVAEAGLAGERDVITTVTLSKSLGSQGGAVLGAPEVVAHLVDTARSFIFDTGLNPPAAGAALAAAQIVAAEPLLAKTVLARAADLAHAAGVSVTDSAIVPVIIGDAHAAGEAADRLMKKGIHVACFRPPSVRKGTARLRITARANLADADIDRLRSALAEP